MKICVECRGPVGEDWQCSGCGHAPHKCGVVLSFLTETQEDDGFRAEYFSQLAAVEGGHFWFRARNRLLIWALVKYFPGATSFLEIGCGTGFVLAGIHQHSPALKVAGSELFRAGLDCAAERVPSALLFQIDARRLPFDREFDVIGAFDVLEHIEQDDVVLKEMFRATKPGGGILLTVPRHPFLWSEVDAYSFHKRRYIGSEMKQKLSAAGFRLIRMTSFVTFLMPMMMLSRLCRKSSSESFDPLSEFRIGRGLDAALETVMNVERRIIQSGVSLPAGGSLLAVARRDE